MISGLSESHGRSGLLGKILRSPIDAKGKAPRTINPSDLERNGSEADTHQRPLSPDNQSGHSAGRHQPLPQVVTLSPPIGQFFINSLLQGAGFVAAIAFGIYAVKSVRVGNTANQYASEAVLQAVTANQLALLAVCLSNRNQEVGQSRDPFQLGATFTEIFLYSPDGRYCSYLL
jgi:hypothetical protein